MIDLVEKSNAQFIEMIKPGAFLVDFIPQLARFPRWLPGMGSLAIAEERKKDALAKINTTFEYTTSRMVRRLIHYSDS